MWQIYVPVEDIWGHWFLMVVAFHEIAIYHVDSFPDVYIVPDCQAQIRVVVNL